MLNTVDSTTSEYPVALQMEPAADQVMRHGGLVLEQLLSRMNLMLGTIGAGMVAWAIAWLWITAS